MSVVWRGCESGAKIVASEQPNDVCLSRSEIGGGGGGDESW